jgi:hypothetical protein
VKPWRVDYRTGCGRWLPVGWWGHFPSLLAFLRYQANVQRVTFRIRREAA